MIQEEQIKQLKFMQAVFDNLTELIFLTDESGNIIDSNCQAQKHCGYSSSELRTLSLADILADTLADKLPDILKEERSFGGITLETSLKTKDGKSIPVHLRTKLIDMDGSRRRLVTVFPEADAPRKTPEKIAEKPAGDLTEILPEVSNEPELLFEMDKQGYLISANRDFYEKTGYTQDDIKNGLSVEDILSGDEVSDYPDVLDRISDSGSNNFSDYSLVCKDGSFFPVMGSFSVVSRAANKHGFKAHLFDISEQKHFEHNLKMMEKLNALGEIASGVIHDFNNILSLILGNLDLLEKQVSSPQTRSIANKIRRAALDGSEIVRRLQNFSQLYIQNSAEQINVNKVIKEAISLLGPKRQAFQRSQRISISLETEFGDVRPVLTTSSEFREVIINILFNAFDALPSGGAITIKTALLDNFVMIAISDNGIGMSPITKKRLFEPFYTTKKKKGTGLGLSISYGIIKKYGGDITIVSEEGSGSTFTITLPVLKDEPAETRRIDARIGAGQSGDILVVDDEINICNLLKEYLESEGHQVVVAVSGKKALELLEQQAFSIILTDLNMPEVSGWEVACFARKHHPDSAIIMLSGWEDPIQHINKEEKIIDHILQKPVSFSTLSEIIGTLKLKE